MDSKAYVLDVMRSTGESKARALRESANAMTGTEIIAQEDYVPDWREDGDYTAAPIGTPVQHAGQVYTLLQPHSASHYPGTSPAALAALWRVKHTTDPEKAKPWVKPTSTSDMYLVDECMIWTDGLVYRCKSDTVYSPAEYAPAWALADEPAGDPDTGGADTTYPEWAQPTGAHDAYGVGDIVSYKGQLYRSLIAGNVYAPDAYPAGWEVVA